MKIAQLNMDVVFDCIKWCLSIQRADPAPVGEHLRWSVETFMAIHYY